MQTGPRLPLPTHRFADLVLSWYQQNKRRLPWRERPDPYRIWLSEVMLQQTQVKTVLPYFERFVKTYPTLESLARAEEEEVLSLWSGLGYYGRARNLHRCAQLIRDSHQGRFPSRYAQAIDLPGVGRYTAGAVLSIAYGQPLPVVDGNIRRLMTRYLKIEEESTSQTSARLWPLMQRLVRHPCVQPRVADFNQALMELGSLLCTPRNPDCPACPLAGSCRAKREDLQQILPRTLPRRPLHEQHYTVALIRDGDRCLLRKISEGTFLRGLWEFPRIEGRPGPHSRLRFRKIHGLHLRLGSRLEPVIHQITSRRLNLHPVRARLLGPLPGRSFAWVAPDDPRRPVSAYVRKIVTGAG